MPPLPQVGHPVPAGSPRPDPGDPHPHSSGPVGQGFHTDGESLVTAATEIDNVVADVGKYRLSKPPNTSAVGDQRVAEALGAYLAVQIECTRWVRDELAAMAAALRVTARDYTAAEQHAKDGIAPNPSNPAAPHSPPHHAPSPGTGPDRHPVPSNGAAPDSAPGPGQHSGDGHGGTDRGGPGNSDPGGPGGIGDGGSGQGGTTPAPDWRPLPRNPGRGNVRMASDERPLA